MSRSAIRSLLGILLLLIILAAGAGGFFWWKISRLKEALVRDLEQTLGSQVEISSLDFDPWHGELHAAGINLTNTRPDAPWDKGDISQAAIRFHLRDLFSPTLPLEVDVSSWNVTLHSLETKTPGTTISPANENEAAPAPSPAGPGGIHVQISRLSAHEGSVTIQLSSDKQIVIHGVSFDAENNGANIWTTNLQAESVAAGSLMAGASSVDIRGEPDKVTFSNLKMECGQGFLTGDGEIALGDPHHITFDLKATDVPVKMLVSVDWQMKLSGLISGTLHYEGSMTSGTAQGQLAAGSAKFNMLPWLGKVTALVSLPDISNVEVDKATTDFLWKDGMLHLTNLDVRKNDVTRIAGTVDIDAKNEIDGKLKLGLPSTVTAKWPDLQTKIFSVRQDDYNWTDVHLTGTPDHLQEDLTPRLLAAGLQEGNGLINQAAQKATDLIKGFLGN